MMYWRVGEYISRQSKNASYGDSYIQSLADFFSRNYPQIKGFNRRGLYRMKQFYETYKDDEKVSPLVTQLSWTNHLKLLSACKSNDERFFYMQLCIKENYSKRELARQVDSGYYERYSFYKDYYYYQCKHRTTVNGHKCGYKRQWKQESVDNAVAEVIGDLVNKPKFEEAIRQKIGAQIDTKELEKELAQLHKQLRQLNGAKDRLGQQMDSLDITDKHYDRMYSDMENRLYKFYDEIGSVEQQIEETETRILNIRQDRISENNIYQFLLYFNEFYDRFTDAEKKEFLNCFIERVDIYEQEQSDGRFLKHIKFRFPVFYDEKEMTDLSWDNETTLETVVLLSRKNA